MDLGDRAVNSTIDFTFSTRNVSAAPATLAGTPVVSVYKANGTTQSVAGITLTVDFDSLTGDNHVRIVTTDAFYATANDYMVKITTGTVNSVSVVGNTIATFSIENRFMRGTDSALLAASINLTAGAVDNVTTVATTTTNTDMRGTDSALLAASINLTAGAVDNVTTVATTTTNTDMRGTDSALLAASINLTAGAVDNVTLVATTTTNTDMRGTDSAALASVCTETRLAELDAGNLPADNAAISGQITALNDFNPGSDAVANVTLVATTTTNTDMVAEPTAILTTQMTESYAADGVAPTVAQALFIIQQTIGDFAIAGTTITVKQLDGSTTAATYTLDDGTNPTSRTRTT